MAADPDLQARPSVDVFVRNLIARVDAGYPKTVAAIAKALAMVGADANQAIEFLRNPKTKAAFLVGCCAEELAGLDLDLRSSKDKQFVRELVAQLQPHSRPLRARAVSSDFRRLLADFLSNPTEMRLQTACHMLEKNGLSELRKKLEKNAVAALSIECSVLIDGIAGTLLDSLPRRQKSPGWSDSFEDAAVAASSRPRSAVDAAADRS